MLAMMTLVKQKRKADPETVSLLVLLMLQLYSQKKEVLKIMMMTMEKKRLLVLHLWR